MQAGQLKPERGHCNLSCGRRRASRPVHRLPFLTLQYDDSLPGPGPSSIDASTIAAAAAATALHAPRRHAALPQRSNFSRSRCRAAASRVPYSQQPLFVDSPPPFHQLSDGNSIPRAVGVSSTDSPSPAAIEYDIHTADTATPTVNPATTTTTTAAAATAPLLAAATSQNRSSTDVHDGSDGDDDDGAYMRLPDRRQLVIVRHDTTAAAAAGALSRALGRERRAVVRFGGGGSGLKGLRVLTLANIFMGQFDSALSFVVDVRQVPTPPPSPLSPRGAPGSDPSFQYRVQARSRRREEHELQLGAAMRRAPFLLDLSINVRQAWDQQGEVDEEAAYDMADTLYAALAAQQAQQDAEAAAVRQQQAAEGKGRQQRRQGRGTVNASGDATHGVVRSSSAAARAGVTSPVVYVSADLAQGLTTFTGLALLQRRLREEGQQAVVETTMYRASVAAPRLDGSDGWVFTVRLAWEAPYKSPSPSQQSSTSVTPHQRLHNKSPSQPDQRPQPDANGTQRQQKQASGRAGMGTSKWRTSALAGAGLGAAGAGLGAAGAGPEVGPLVGTGGW